MKKLIATDLDGIIGDTDLVLRRAIENYFGISINRAAVTDYFYENCLDISVQEFEKFWKWFSKTDFWEKVRLLSGAADALYSIAKKYRIAVFTSRPATLKIITRKWLDRKGLGFIEEVYHVDELGGSKLSAIEAVSAKPLFYLEDRLDFAEQVATKFRVLLFDYPWNRKARLEGNIVRVKGWSEAMREIRKG